MTEEYTIRPKHGIGKIIYSIDKDSWGEKKPKVITGKVAEIIVNIAENTSEPIIQYRVKIADSCKDDSLFFDHQLLTKSEAVRRYESMCKQLKTFDDIYLKTMLDKAHKLIKAYKK